MTPDHAPDTVVSTPIDVWPNVVRICRRENTWTARIGKDTGFDVTATSWNPADAILLLAGAMRRHGWEPEELDPPRPIPARRDPNRIVLCKRPPGPFSDWIAEYDGKPVFIHRDACVCLAGFALTFARRGIAFDPDLILE